jgi:PPOX class probable F420-dependent enzyme
MPAHQDSLDSVQVKLQQARVARLATTDPDGRPHVVPICFAYDGSHFYTAVDLKPKRRGRSLTRVRNIESQPQVALLVDEYQEDWDRLWYVLVRGRARLLDESEVEERRKALSLLRKKYPQYQSGLLPEDAPLIRITPQRISPWGRP